MNIDETTKEEFAKMLAEMELGKTVEDAFKQLEQHQSESIESAKMRLKFLINLNMQGIIRAKNFKELKQQHPAFYSLVFAPLYECFKNGAYELPENHQT